MVLNHVLTDSVLTVNNVQNLQDFRFIFVNIFFKSVETLDVNRRLLSNKLAYICFGINIVGTTVRIYIYFKFFFTLSGILFA